MEYISPRLLRHKKYQEKTPPYLCTIFSLFSITIFMYYQEKTPKFINFSWPLNERKVYA